MYLRVAQVKCYNCGRICGEVSAPSPYELDLEDVYRPDYAIGYGLSQSNYPRCSRCEGAVFIDEPFTAGAGELLLPQDVQSRPGIRNRNPLTLQVS